MGDGHENGIPLRQIQQYLGHSSLQTTMVYLHLTDTAAIDARRVINDLFRRPRPEPPEAEGHASRGRTQSLVLKNS